MKVRTIRLFPALFVCLLLAACSGRPAYKVRVIDTPETRGLKGYEKPYEVNGERYDPLRSHAGFVEEGIASWYGADFHGKKTSNGETYNMHARTAAHKTLPLGVFVKVVSKDDGRSTTVRINDRGPFVRGRIIDLSYAGARELGFVGPGTTRVRIEALGFRETTPSEQTVYHQPPSYDVGSFTVQVGAFTQRDNAEQLAGQLRNRYGVPSIRQGWVNGRLFHRVRVGSYATIKAAEEARAGFEIDGFPDSFVVAVE